MSSKSCAEFESWIFAVCFFLAPITIEMMLPASNANSIKKMKYTSKCLGGTLTTAMKPSKAKSMKIDRNTIPRILKTGFGLEALIIEKTKEGTPNNTRFRI